MIRFMRLLLCVAVLLGGETVSFSSDASVGIPDDSWPASWFVAPVSASASGIKSFQQSSCLDERVASGDLPAVTERLRLLLILAST